MTNSSFRFLLLKGGNYMTMTYESIINLVKESAGEPLTPSLSNKLSSRDLAIFAERMNGGELSFAYITVLINSGAIVFNGADGQWRFGVYKNGDGFYYNSVHKGKGRSKRKAEFIKTEAELKELLLRDGYYVEKPPIEKPVQLVVSEIESVKKFDEMIMIPVTMPQTSSDKHIIMMNGEPIPCDIGHDDSTVFSVKNECGEWVEAIPVISSDRFRIMMRDCNQTKLFDTSTEGPRILVIADPTQSGLTIKVGDLDE